MLMIDKDTFNVTIGGVDYYVETWTQNDNDRLIITAHNGNYILTDCSGYCNPLRSLWRDWRYRTVYGAARYAMELKRIKQCVINEISEHISWCYELEELAMDDQ